MKQPQASTRKVLLALGGLALAALVSVAMWPDAEPAQPLVVRDVPTPVAAASPHPQSAATNAPTLNVLSVAPPARAWIEGYYGGNLYAQVQALREARQPGSFATSIKLVQPCVGFVLSEQRAALKQASAQARPNYAARVQAQQVLAARCSGIDEQMHFALLDPLPGDADAQRYREANSRFLTHSKDPGLPQAIEELLRQGQVVKVLRAATAVNPHWEGQAWTGDAGEYALALQLADYRLHSLPGRERDDLRMLVACMAYEICDYDATSDIRKLPAARQPIVFQLAAEMEAALREGRLEPFIKRPGR